MIEHRIHSYGHVRRHLLSSFMMLRSRSRSRSPPCRLPNPDVQPHVAPPTNVSHASHVAPPRVAAAVPATMGIDMQFEVRCAKGKWMTYEAEVNAEIVRAFRTSEGSCCVDINGWHYIIDLVHMVQINTLSYSKRPIRYSNIQRLASTSSMTSMPRSGLPMTSCHSHQSRMQFEVRAAKHKWMSYEAEANAEIVHAHRTGAESCAVDINGWHYRIDLVRMLQINTTTFSERAIRCKAIDHHSSTASRVNELEEEEEEQSCGTALDGEDEGLDDSSYSWKMPPKMYPAARKLAARLMCRGAESASCEL